MLLMCCSDKIRCQVILCVCCAYRPRSISMDANHWFLIFKFQRHVSTNHDVHNTAEWTSKSPPKNSQPTKRKW